MFLPYAHTIIIIIIIFKIKCTISINIKTLSKLFVGITMTECDGGRGHYIMLIGLDFFLSSTFRVKF